MTGIKTVTEYTEPGATLADFLASPQGRMAVLGGAATAMQTENGDFRCTAGALTRPLFSSTSALCMG